MEELVSKYSPEQKSRIIEALRRENIRGGFAGEFASYLVTKDSGGIHKLLEDLENELIGEINRRIYEIIPIFKEMSKPGVSLCFEPNSYRINLYLGYPSEYKYIRGHLRYQIPFDINPKLSGTSKLAIASSGWNNKADVIKVYEDSGFNIMDDSLKAKMEEIESKLMESLSAYDKYMILFQGLRTYNRILDYITEDKFFEYIEQCFSAEKLDSILRNTTLEDNLRMVDQMFK